MHKRRFRNFLTSMTEWKTVFVWVILRFPVAPIIPFCHSHLRPPGKHCFRKNALCGASYLRILLTFSAHRQWVNENNDTININTAQPQYIMDHNGRNIMMFRQLSPIPTPCHATHEKNLFQLTRYDETNSGNKIKYFILVRTNCQ